MMDFSGAAGAATSSDTIPNGQLAWAIVNVRAVKASASGGQYIDMELTLDDNQPYARRKVWEMVGDPNHQGNSEKYRQMGTIAICRMLEAGRGAGPHNPAGYKIDAYEQLSGLRVPVKIGVEKGENGHADKNRVAEFLTPNPASESGHKLYQKLMAGEYAPAGKAIGAAQPNGFGQPPAAAPAQQQAFGGFGNQPAQPAQQVIQPGFQQPQPGVNANAAGWGSSPQGQGNGSQPAANGSTATTTSPSDPTAQPGWLAQANGQA